jgi:hypothetical protein
VACAKWRYLLKQGRNKMATCVEITLEDDGSFSVKECEPKEEAEEMQGINSGNVQGNMDGGEEMEEGYEKQTAGSMDEAFSIASQILGGAQESPQAKEQQGFEAVAKQFGQGGM